MREKIGKLLNKGWQQTEIANLLKLEKQIINRIVKDMVATGELKQNLPYSYTGKPKKLDKYVKSKLTNKQIANLVGISETRVKRYRIKGELL